MFGLSHMLDEQTSTGTTVHPANENKNEMSLILYIEAHYHIIELVDNGATFLSKECSIDQQTTARTFQPRRPRRTTESNMPGTAISQKQLKSASVAEMFCCLLISTV